MDNLDDTAEDFFAGLQDDVGSDAGGLSPRAYLGAGSGFSPRYMGNISPTAAAVASILGIDKGGSTSPHAASDAKSVGSSKISVVSPSKGSIHSNEHLQGGSKENQSGQGIETTVKAEGIRHAFTSNGTSAVIEKIAQSALTAAVTIKAEVRTGASSSTSASVSAYASKVSTNGTPHAESTDDKDNRGSSKASHAASDANRDQSGTASSEAASSRGESHVTNTQGISSGGGGKNGRNNNKLPRITTAASKNRISSDDEEEEKEIPIPERIVTLLVPNMSVAEVMQLVKRIKQTEKPAEQEEDVVASLQNSGPRYICDVCGNCVESNFVQDYARGDTVCLGKDGSGCGNVVQDHIVFEGEASRTFEGEEDKSHHGAAPNKLFSSGFNLRTMISADGEDAGGLRRAAEFVEMNLSQMGKDERRTRVGYKDQMKRKAFDRIVHVAANLDLHDSVITRAQLMFAEFRDVREHVHQFEAMVAASIIAATMEAESDSLYDGRSGQRQLMTYQDFTALMQKKKKQTMSHELTPFSCPHCGAKFNAKRGLQFHRCAQMPKTDSSIDSELPRRKTSIDRGQRKTNGEQGSSSNGASKPWHNCDQCSMKFSSAMRLEEHKARHQRKRKLNPNIDIHMAKKKNLLASANPSVQLPATQGVLFRGSQRRPWLSAVQNQARD